MIRPKWKNKLVSVGVVTLALVLLFSVYWATSAGEAPHDYFKRLGQAFLAGRWWLTENPPWLNELIPDNGHFYVVYPPMPALLSIPFLLVWGSKFEQQWLAHLVGVGVAYLAGLLAWNMTKKRSVAIWMFLLAGLGTINWYHAATGSVWLLGQLVAEFFVLWALVESYGQKRVWLISVLVGCAYWSRLQMILSLPLFIYLFKNQLFQPRLKWKPIFIFGIGTGIFVVANFIYNFARYRSIFDLSYFRIPGLFEEPWYKHGLFNWLYIPEHLKVMFKELPRFLPTFPFVRPTWAGLAIWITTPAFVYTLGASLVSFENILLWLTILAIGLTNFSHGSTGFAQFGYRFAMDFYPFLFLLIIKGLKRGLKWHHWLLLMAGVVVNLWGVLWINKFNWVGW
jgi:hypothetical protein